MSGKGSTRRPSAIPASQVADNWAKTFAAGSEAATGLRTVEAATPSIDFGDLVWVNVAPTEGT